MNGADGPATGLAATGTVCAKTRAGNQQPSTSISAHERNRAASLRGGDDECLLFDMGLQGVEASPVPAGAADSCSPRRPSGCRYKRALRRDCDGCSHRPSLAVHDGRPVLLGLVPRPSRGLVLPIPGLTAALLAVISPGRAQRTDETA